MSERVFVYGSLLRGLGNHRLLEGATMVAETETADACFTMQDLGAFPGVVIGGADKIVGEVYEVNAHEFRALDYLEGFPSMYTRALVRLASGDEAWMYIYNRRDVGERVASGDWRAHEAERRAADERATWSRTWRDEPVEVEPWADPEETGEFGNLDETLDEEDPDAPRCDACGENLDVGDDVVSDGCYSAHRSCLEACC